MLSDPGVQAGAGGGVTSAAPDPAEPGATSAQEPRVDPTEHPLVKGVMAQFAAKILDVRRKE